MQAKTPAAIIVPAGEAQSKTRKFLLYMAIYENND